MDVGRRSVPRGCEPCSAPESAVGDTITKITTVDWRKPVYNLAVANQPEFYANGLLVHNCMWVFPDPSPNRMDALVWGITELLNLGTEYVEDIDEAVMGRRKKR